MEDVGFNASDMDLSPRISISELESIAHSAELDTVLLGAAPATPPPDTAWVTFEAEVRTAHASAVGRVRQYGGERCAELLRLLEIEEQTRCHAFQETQLGEVRPAVYQATVRSILEKLLGKLETMGSEPALYQGAAQCLSEYMSALNHHSDLSAVPHSPRSLPAIVEGFDYGDFSSDMYSERSEDTDTLSVHSDQVMGGAEQSISLSNSGSISSSGGVEGGAVILAELRKERRRESNKKAASKYRTKKMASTQCVVAESAAMRQHMNAISEQNAVLSAENRLLKQQVAFLQSMLNPAAQPPTPTPSVALPAAEILSAQASPSCK